MTFELASESIVRGPDGVLYRIRSGKSEPMVEASEAISQTSIFLDAGRETDHGSSRVRVSPDDDRASRVRIEPGDVAMDAASSRVRVSPDDDRASRVRIEPGDAAMDAASSRVRVSPDDDRASRVRIEPGYVTLSRLTVDPAYV
jgi:hypothetical protein